MRRHTFQGALLLLLLSGASPGQARARGDQAPLAVGTVPSQGLCVYFEFDGLDAHERAWRGTAAHGVLTETPTGAMLSALAAQLEAELVKAAPEMKPIVAEVTPLLEQGVHGGFIAAILEVPDGPSTGAGRPGRREVMERILTSLCTAAGSQVPRAHEVRGRAIVEVAPRPEVEPDPAPADAPAPEPAPAEEGLPGLAEKLGIAVPSGPVVAWWAEQEDLVVVLTSERGGIDSILDAIEGKQPSAATHPARLGLVSERGPEGFEPVAMFFIDPAQLLADQGESLRFDRAPRTTVFPAPPELGPEPLPPPPDPDVLPPAPPPGEPEPPLPPGVDARPDGGPLAQPDSPEVDATKILNLAGFQRISGRWGFQGKALLCDLRIEAPAPRTGLPHLLDQPTLSRDALAFVPSGSGQIALVSFDLAAIFDQVATLASALDPEARAVLAEVEKAVRESAGVELRGELLAALGSEWTFFSANTPGDDGPSPSLLVSIRDRDALLRQLDILAERFNQAFRDAEQAAGGDPNDAVLTLLQLPEPDRGFVLHSPTGLAWDGGEPLEPTLLVGASHMVLALSPSDAREALAAENDPEHRWRPEKDTAEALAQLPEELTLLVISDSRDSWLPDAIAHLPRTVQSLSNLVSVGFASETSPADFLLAGLGLPRPGGFRVRIDPALVPRAGDVRPYLFPSLCAATVDDRGLRIIIREALPLASAHLDSAMSWDTKLGQGDSKVKFTLDKWLKRQTAQR